MAEEEETFKFTDRRGRAEDVPSSVSRDRTTPQPEAAPATADSPAPDRPASAARAGARGSEGLDLQGIFMMFASSALINMGAAADPVSGGRHVDMEQARGAIDALLLLREKTAGNRTNEESRFLEQIVYDLQMRFVRAAGHDDSRPSPS